MTDLELIGGELQEKLEPEPEPKPKRKYRRRKKTASGRGPGRPKKAAALPADFDGIGPSTCPIACNADHCVITGENVCGHPYKGGLQAAYLTRKDVLGRFGNARSALAQLEAESKRK